MVSTDVPAEDAPISELYHLHAKRHRPRSSLFVYLVYHSDIVSRDLNIQGMDEWQDSFAGFVHYLQFYVNLGLLPRLPRCTLKSCKEVSIICFFVSGRETNRTLSHTASLSSHQMNDVRILCGSETHLPRLSLAQRITYP